MNDKEISEIRRRYRAEKSGISRIRGCYVNEKRTIISEFDQSLGLMSESEAEEVLTLLRKALSGKVGTNLMDIAFSTAQVQSGAEHGLLMTLRESALGDDAAVHAFYEKVIGSLALEGNYMILLCHDSYDVFSYHKDGGRSEDSGEIFRYILCAICPVSMAKPALSYFVRDNCFRNITADSVVAPPALGFLFPAFDNRSTNIYNALYYSRNTKENQDALIEAVFNTPVPKPAAEQKKCFEALLTTSLGEECSMDVVQTIHEQLCERMELHKESKVPDPLLIDKQVIKDVLTSCGVSETGVSTFSVQYDEAFGFEAELHPKNIIDSKHFEIHTPDIAIKIDPTRTDLVETRVIGGVKYIMINADEDVEVNGVSIHFQGDQEQN